MAEHLTAPLSADPLLYDFEEIDEMGMAALATARTIRDRLVAHFAFDEHTARTAAGIVDEYALEIIQDAEPEN